MAQNRKLIKPRDKHKQNTKKLRYQDDTYPSVRSASSHASSLLSLLSLSLSLPFLYISLTPSLFYISLPLPIDSSQICLGLSQHLKINRQKVKKKKQETGCLGSAQVLIGHIHRGVNKRKAPQESLAEPKCKNVNIDVTVKSRLILKKNMLTYMVSSC